MKFIFYSPAVGAPWDYTSLESGVGGSETFHIEMATRLARRGHEVISYNDKPDRDVFDVSRGVCWRQISELDMNFDRVNGPAIWVVQRNPLFIDRPSPSGPNPQKWWHVYHDVQYAPHDTPARMARYDRVIALSEFHAEFLRNMGHENVTASRGGIAVDRMHELVARIMECAPMVCRSIPEGNACRPRSAEEKADYLTRGRNPTRLIYASAPERGLLPLLRMFARAKQHVAELELHVYYGWEGYDRQLAQDFTGRWAREKAEMVRLLAQPGVTWHGRVTQTELWTAHLQSGIWVYPTEYPEVCCVTAMEAQALGAIPIYTPTWALQDHVFSGICLEGACSEDRLAHARFAMEIVRLASSPAVQEAKRPGMMAEASARFDWEGVCDQFEEMAVVDLGDTATRDTATRRRGDTAAPAPTPRPAAPVLWPADMKFGDDHPKDVFAHRADGSVFGRWFGDENKRNLFINPRKCLGTVAYIAVGNNPEPFTWSMVQLVQFCNEYVCTEPGEWIHWAHNTKSGQIIARNALAQGMMGDWLLMLDSDHDFEPDLLYRLLSAFTARDMDVLGGFYQFKEFPHQPMAWLYLPDKGGYCQVASPSDAEGKTTTWDRTAPNMLMGVIGGGCMLISRRAIEMLVTKFGDAPFNPIGIYGTDDFDFCERCRLAGIQVWWSTRIECPHLQTRAITLADYGQAHVMGNVA